MNNTRKIAFVGPTDRSIWSFRKDLIELMMSKKGWKVYVVCPAGDYVEQITNLGAIHVPINQPRFISVIGDLLYIAALYKILKINDFDLVHTFTIKPNVYVNIIRYFLKIKKVVCLVEGFGFLYGYDNLPLTKIKRIIFFFLNKIGLRVADKVWFINKDDLFEMVDKNCVSQNKAVFIKSVGVNLEDFTPEKVSLPAVDKLRSELGLNGFSVVVTLIARMNWLKGIKEFVETSKRCKVTHPNAIFLIVGEIQDGSPYSIPKNYFIENEDSNCKWLDFRSDINEINYITDIACLPSYYREGVPRSLIESMAFSKPIVTTDSPGCRELVEHGENGYLVEPKSVDSLTSSIKFLLDDDKLRKKMGARSRQIVENELDVNIINQQVVEKLYDLSS